MFIYLFMKAFLAVRPTASEGPTIYLRGNASLIIFFLFIFMDGKFHKSRRTLVYAV